MGLKRKTFCTIPHVTRTRSKAYFLLCFVIMLQWLNLGQGELICEKCSVNALPLLLREYLISTFGCWFRYNDSY